MDTPTEQEPGERRRLDRPPSGRFAPPADPVQSDAAAVVKPGPTDRAVRAAAVGLAGVAAFVVLGGPLSVTAGLVAVAAVVGWLEGLVLGSTLRAVGLAVGTVAVGLVGIWFFAQSEGGALGLVDYLAQVQGVLVPVELVVAGAVAAGSAR